MLNKSAVAVNPSVVLTFPNPSRGRTFLLSRPLDFWALGGLSILVCLVLQLASFYREDFVPVQNRFTQMVAVFSFLSLFCNHPHFMISYRFGYGRGVKFIFQNWFQLILVPTAIIVFYAIAFLNFDTPFSEGFATKINGVLAFSGLGFQLTNVRSVGAEILSLSIWFMYLTVGWHYCKQVYGCMMVYSFFDGYKLTSLQKKIFKASLISVAIYQFVYVSSFFDKTAANGKIEDSRFPGIHLSILGLPEWASVASIAVMILLSASAIAMMVAKFFKTRQRPSWNFLIPWVAFYVWWIPVGRLPEFYFLTIPFFHSLQYIPFALRVENRKIIKSENYNVQVFLRLLSLLLVGFMAFELVPSILDKSLSTDVNQSAWFFVTAFAVFINIHHFFIDSVVWKFKNTEVQDLLIH